MYYFVGSIGANARDVKSQNINAYCKKNCLKKLTAGKLLCECGEDVKVFEWYWNKEEDCTNVRLSNNNREILFHPVYSSGTAIIKGNVPFQLNKHYFWEIKMISNLYGTDVMVGVGTNKMQTSDLKIRFCSVLGYDKNSWGYSYHGSIQHDGCVRNYGQQFGLGSLVGVHLDMCNGTMEYYLNKKPLGIAFTGLKSKELFPMVSSTAAQSAMKTSCAVSEESSLQLICLQYIMKYPHLYKQYKNIPGLRRQFENKYFWIVPREETEKRKADLEDLAVFPLTSSKKRRKFYLPIKFVKHTATRKKSCLKKRKRLKNKESNIENEEDSNSSSASESECSSSSGDGEGGRRLLSANLEEGENEELPIVNIYDDIPEPELIELPSSSSKNYDEDTASVSSNENLGAVDFVYNLVRDEVLFCKNCNIRLINDDSSNESNSDKKHECWNCRVVI